MRVFLILLSTPVLNQFPGLVHILQRILVEAVSSKTVVGALHEGILHAIPRRNDMEHSSPTGTQNNISLLVISVPLSHTTISGNNRRSALAVLPSSQSVPLFSLHDI